MKRGKTKYLILIMICGYLFFFSSNLWLGEDSSKLVKATPINKVVGAGKTRKLLVYSWEFDEKKNEMLVNLCISNSSAIDTNEIKFEYTAVETSGKINVEKLVENNDYIFLRLKDVPKDFKEISLRIYKDKTSKNPFTKIYTNRLEVTRTNISENLSSKKLLNKYLQTMIDLTLVDANKNLDLIDANKKKLNKLNKKLKELDKEKTYKVGDDLELINSEYTEIQNEIESLNNSNEDLENEIKTYQNRITNFRERKVK